MAPNPNFCLFWGPVSGGGRNLYFSSFFLFRAGGLKWGLHQAKNRIAILVTVLLVTFSWRFRGFVVALIQLTQRGGVVFFAKSKNHQQTEFTKLAAVRTPEICHIYCLRLSGQAIRTPTFRRFAQIDSQKKPIFEAFGQIRANRVFSPIRIQIRAIRVFSPIRIQIRAWELVDPVVADPVRQDNDKKNNIQIYTEISY